MFTMIRHVLLAVALCSLALALLSARADVDTVALPGVVGPAVPAR